MDNDSLYNGRSLADILNGPISTPPERDGEQYAWQPMYSAKSIREYAYARTFKENVTVTGYTRDILGYGDRYQHAIEAYEYDDGSILLAAMISDWGGTFASHDDIRVHYFILTPHCQESTGTEDRR